VIHVGVICGGRMLTPEQRASLGRRLQHIAERHRGYAPVLHHGCGNDADEAAHRTVRTFGNWLIHGHPASESSGQVMIREGVILGLNRICESKPPAQRDAEIIDASDIIIVIRNGESQAQIDMAVRRAQAANRELVFLKITTVAQKPPARKQDPILKPESATTEERTLEWAARQARSDSLAGNPCQRYKDFRAKYDLPKCDISLQMWNSYYPNRTKSGGAKKASPKPKANRNAKVRLTAIPNRRSSSRPSVKRYDLMQPLPFSDLSPSNAALLMRVNQQNTLGEMWR
jgi:hypothetical protein